MDSTNGAVNAFNTNLASLLALSSPESYVARLRTIRGVNKSANNSAIPSMTIINTGDFNLDARNLTTRESRQIVLNAIEGLDSIDRVITR